MDKALKDVQREFVEALLHPSAGQRVLDTLIGESARNQNGHFHSDALVR